MEIRTHRIGSGQIAEVVSPSIVIRNTEDGIDLMGNLYYQEFGGMILHEINIAPEFFDLRTGIAGEVLQKFSTYRFRLAIAGDFSKYESRALQDFIFESNKQRHVCFVASVAEALEKLAD